MGLFSTPRRSRKLPPHEERVLILGGSRGIGRELALKYALAGSRVCVVARQEPDLVKVADECRAVAQRNVTITDYEPILSLKGDCTRVEDMVDVRSRVQTAWGGVDTLVVCAGVSTLLPFCELAGQEARGSTFNPPFAEVAAIERAIDVVNSVTQTNFIGPAIAAATFIPMLAASKAPSVLLVSCLTAAAAAPTVSVCSAAKAAALALYQSLAIENPFVTFTYILPSIVRGTGFYDSPADGGHPRGVDPNRSGVSQEAVVTRAMNAVDRGERTVFIPGTGAVSFWLSYLFPSFIARRVQKRYGYPPVA